MLNINDSILVIVDVQEKLTDMLKENTRLSIEKSAKIAKAANILSIETVITEQYPKGLGQTVDEVKKAAEGNCFYFEKTNFAITKEPEISDKINTLNKKQVVILGIEAHICVFQSAVLLKEKGYEVFVVEDACFSRNELEKESAMRNLRHLNILTPSLESVLFMWLEGSKNPNFKEVQALIK